MSAVELLGTVGASLLRERLLLLSQDDGIARFMLDRLTGEHAAAIVRAILDDPAAAAKIAIRMPRDLVASFGLPEEVVTDERSVRLRNTEVDRQALLLANTADDQETSLLEITLLGAKQLTEEPRMWVQAASAGTGLPDEQKAIWEAALRGLVSSADWTLHQVSNYVSLTRQAIVDESKPVLEALGWALPALHLPRHSEYFLAGRPAGVKAHSKWKKSFDKLVSERRPLLQKHRPPRQIIEAEELLAQFAAVKDELPPVTHQAIVEFVRSPPSWNVEAAALAEFEWESQSILQLFSGLRTKKVHLAEETLEFFDDEMPDRLAETEKEYLRESKTRKEPHELDREFFEAHREDLGKSRQLRAKWERFIFGRPIECTEFLDGLLLALERLHGQTEDLGSSRTLQIRAGRKTKNQWRELNADVAIAFAVRYRGLDKLMGSRVKWENTEHLFDYEGLLLPGKSKKVYKRNVSTSRTSLQIKFDVTLKVGSVPTTVQLIWIGKPSAIGLEFKDDLDRLVKRPLTVADVARQPVSRKGGLQAVSLDDVLTLQPAYRQDAGSLIPKSDGGEDIAKTFPKRLKEVAASKRISAASVEAIEKAWQAFLTSYSAAMTGLRENGLSDPALLEQAELYGRLLKTLAVHAPGDLNRRELLEPVLKIGCVAIKGGAPSAIVAPWHPLRLAGTAVKARSVAGLVKHVLTADDVIFGDRRLFFGDLREELAHPYYPEICVGYSGAEPVLLSETGTVNGYSLMERPVRDPSEAVTDVDPAEAAKQIRTLLERYLDLQPHERSNLSIMLYNCDAAGLPLATVNALGSVHDEDEMHCNVLVRHRDRKKLGRVYGELLERAEGDPDTLVVSETSANFMSKLRIGVMLDGGSGASAEPHGVDVAFLHDVVSRQAKVEWFSVPASDAEPDILDHVPARWSYRRVTAEDELKATSYIVCPRQPAAGWAYLDAVAAVIRQRGSAPDEHMLPARQISFQDHNLKEMFEEVHSLAEWVATYDDLLDKRQLAAQGINVIRYRRQRTHGRNMIVSSTSELRLLRVLVGRRLAELSLGLPDDRLSTLAEKMIRDACDISGDIVLRAARRGVSAGELIGLVLSRALVAEELGDQSSVAWFLLDDYAEWLGQREQGIADILALSVDKDEDGRATLRAVVTEAKYVSAETSGDGRRTSKHQLRQTVQRIEEALFGDPGRLDRDLWLSRISDLLLDGTTALGKSSALEAVRDGIRNGATPIDLRGYSHVFIHGPADAASAAGEQEPIDDVTNGLQEIFGREELRNLVKAYEQGSPLKAARVQLGTEHPWDVRSFRNPAPRVSWTNKDMSPARTEPLAPESVVEATPAAAPQKSEPKAPAPHASPVEVADRSTGLPAEVVTPAQAAPALPAPDRKISLQALIESRARELSTEVQDQVWLDSTAQKLRSALLGYGLQAKVVGTRLTPNAALIRFMGSDRLGIDDIHARESSLLTTHGLRLVALSPLPGEIVVAVARPQRQTVSLWDVWASRKLNRNTAGQNTSIVLGLKELDGEVLYLNLGSAFGAGQSHEPHTLVAGATGSGKSVLIQAMILDIAATNPSSVAQIVLIDPKMGVDYTAIERLPHIRGGIVIDQGRAKLEMEGLVAEMERRYETFRRLGVRDLRTYNAAVEAAERLPMLFLVHDEFAEWMLTEDYKDAVASNVQRLGVKARAAGIHLVFAAQRPDANVMPIQLRDNLGNRLILKVASVGTSEIALGQKGAESLLGQGHLAARLSGEGGIVFAQAPFLSDSDIDEVVDAIIEGEAIKPVAEGVRDFSSQEN